MKKPSWIFISLTIVIVLIFAVAWFWHSNSKELETSSVYTNEITFTSYFKSFSEDPGYYIAIPGTGQSQYHGPDGSGNVFIASSSISDITWVYAPTTTIIVNEAGTVLKIGDIKNMTPLIITGKSMLPPPDVENYHGFSAEKIVVQTK
jgi:hypothetical protein